MAELRDLSAEEVKAVPEVAVLPEGATVLSITSDGTYDGTRFDGIDPCALYDCWFVCSGAFPTIAGWMEDRLHGLGWPTGTDVENAAGMAWRQWTRGKETVELLDFTQSNWTMFAKPPEGMSLVRLNYTRQPIRDFASEDEYQSWFKEGQGKGERWRNRLQ